MRTARSRSASFPGNQEPREDEVRRCYPPRSHRPGRPRRPDHAAVVIGHPHQDQLITRRGAAVRRSRVRGSTVARRHLNDLDAPHHCLPFVLGTSRPDEDGVPTTPDSRSRSVSAPGSATAAQVRTLCACHQPTGPGDQPTESHRPGHGLCPDLRQRDRLANAGRSSASGHITAGQGTYGSGL